MGLAPPEQQPLTRTTTASIYNQPKSEAKPKTTPGRTMRKLSNAKDKLVDKTKKSTGTVKGVLKLGTGPALRNTEKPNKEKEQDFDQRGFYDARDSPPRGWRPLTRREAEEQEGYD